MDTTTAFLEEAVDSYQKSDENRTVKLRLAKDATHEKLTLHWHAGQRYKKSPTIELKKGMTIVVPIKRARAWFGWFTVPHDMADEPDESKKRDLRQFFQVETERTKLAWGGYVVPRKLSDGMDPIGPHRFPNVEVNVIEWDGTEWGWMSLHELYKLGKYDSLVFHDPKADAQQALEAENAQLRRELSSMGGKIDALIAMQKKAV